MKDFSEYIECLRYKREPLTRAQTCAIAYWEFEEFAHGVVFQGCRKMFTDFTKELKDEMFALVS